MKNKIGLAGICIAIVAIGIAIFQDDIRPEPPSVSTQIADRVSEAVAKIGGIELEESSSKDWVTLSCIGLGFLALVAGIVSFVQTGNPSRS